MEKHIIIQDYEDIEKSKLTLYKTPDNEWYLTDFLFDKETQSLNKVADIIDVYKDYIIFRYNDEVYLFDLKNNKELYRNKDEFNYDFKGNFAFITVRNSTFILNLETGYVVDMNIEISNDKFDNYILYTVNDSSNKTYFVFDITYIVFDIVTGNKTKINLSMGDYIKINGKYMMLGHNGNYSFKNLETGKDTGISYNYSYNPELYNNGYVLLDKNNGNIINLDNGNKVMINRPIDMIIGHYAYHTEDTKNKVNTKYNDYIFSIYDLEKKSFLYENENGHITCTSQYLIKKTNKEISFLDIDDNLNCVFKLNKKTPYDLYSHYLIYGKNSTKTIVDLKNPNKNLTLYGVDTSQKIKIINDKIIYKIKYVSTLYMYDFKSDLSDYKIFSEDIFSKNGIRINNGIIIDPFQDVFDTGEFELFDIEKKKYYSTISIEGSEALSTYSKTISSDNKVSLEKEKYKLICEIASKLTNYVETDENNKTLKKTY